MKKFYLFLMALMLLGCDSNTLSIGDLYVDNEVNPYYCDEGYVMEKVLDENDDIISIGYYQKVIGIPVDCNETDV